MRQSPQRVTAEVLAVRSNQSRPDLGAISSARLVDALLCGGFEVFRVDRSSTILERDGRAVVIAQGARLPRDVVDELRKIAGLTVPQLEELLASSAGRMQ